MKLLNILALMCLLAVATVANAATISFTTMTKAEYLAYEATTWPSVDEGVSGKFTIAGMTTLNQGRFTMDQNGYGPLVSGTYIRPSSGPILGEFSLTGRQLSIGEEYPANRLNPSLPISSGIVTLPFLPTGDDAVFILAPANEAGINNLITLQSLLGQSVTAPVVGSDTAYALRATIMDMGNAQFTARFSSTTGSTAVKAYRDDGVAAASVAPVPEPSAALLAAGSLAIFLGRRHRKN